MGQIDKQNYEPEIKSGKLLKKNKSTTYKKLKKWALMAGRLVARILGMYV